MGRKKKEESKKEKLSLVDQIKELEERNKEIIEQIKKNNGEGIVFYNYLPEVTKEDYEKWFSDETCELDAKSLFISACSGATLDVFMNWLEGFIKNLMMENPELFISKMARRLADRRDSDD